jgi:fused signal recognition particle receptor
MSMDLVWFLVGALVVAIIIGVIVARGQKRAERMPPPPRPDAQVPRKRRRRPPGEVEAKPDQKALPEGEEEEAEEAQPKARPRAPRRDTSVLRAGLARTRGGFIARLGALLGGKKEVDAATLERLEEVLLTADIGPRTAQKLYESVRAKLSKAELTDAEAVWDAIRAESRAILDVPSPPVDWAAHRPFVLLIVGVNGAGKTTTIGKLAAKLAADGRKVLLGAGDTFRAAATQQLEVWGERTGTPVVKGKEGADPSSVLFDAVKRGAAEGYDVVICDTAGRLHTKNELMAELSKVTRVIGKAAPGAPHEIWLVLDATQGQNALAQAQTFKDTTGLSGLIMTKLDGTAKGGVILGISDELQLPVRFIGIGEKVDDLRPFDAEEFVEALYEDAGTELPPPSAEGPPPVQPSA